MPKIERRGRHVKSYEGESPESLEDAIAAAVNTSDVPDGTKLVLMQIEITTEDDPNVGSYRVVLGTG